MPLKLVPGRHGSPNWYIRGSVRGIAVDETTGTHIREKAEEIRIRRETEILDRSIHGIRETATFLEASVMYLDQGGESRYVEKVARHFGTTPLANIDQLAIDRAARMLYPGASPATLNRQVYTPISAILRYASSRRLCVSFDIIRPKQPKGRVRWITIDEANRLIDNCAPHLRPLVVFLLYTGARLSEALYIDWKEIDLARAHAVFLDTKTGDDRGVPLHPRVVVELANMKHRSGPVFLTNRGRPYERKNDDEGGGQIKTAFKGACRRAGIDDFSPHDCRHTWASWHYAANRDLIALMNLGGWKSEKMVLRYAHLNTDTFAASQNNLPWGKSGDGEAGYENSERNSM